MDDSSISRSVSITSPGVLIRWRILLVALALGLSVLSGFAVSGALSSQLLVLWAMLGGACALLFFFSRPQVGLVAAVALAALQYLPTKVVPIFPAAFTVLDDLIVVVVFARTLFDVSMVRKTIRPTSLDFAVLAVIGSAVLSAVVNAVPLLVLVDSLRGYLLYALLYYSIVYLDLVNEGFMRALVLLFLVLCLVQFPFLVFQSVNEGLGDPAFGTLGPGQANNLGFFLAYGVLLAVGWLVASVDGPRHIIWSSIVVLVVSLVLTGARASYLSLLGTLGLSLSSGNLRDKLRLLVAALLILGVLLGLSFALVGGQYYDISVFTNPIDLIINQQLNPATGGRLLWYPIVADIVATYSPTPLVGLGPGMLSSDPAARNPRSYYRLVFDAIGRGNLYNLGAVRLESSFLNSVGEYGVLGLAAFIFLFYHAYGKWLPASCPSFWRGVDWAKHGIVILFVLTGFVGNGWEVQYLSMPVWLLCGILARTGFRYNAEMRGMSA